MGWGLMEKRETGRRKPVDKPQQRLPTGPRAQEGPRPSSLPLLGKARVEEGPAGAWQVGRGMGTGLGRLAAGRAPHSGQGPARSLALKHRRSRRDEWINPVRYVHTMECHSFLKRN